MSGQRQNDTSFWRFTLSELLWAVTAIGLTLGIVLDAIRRIALLQSDTATDDSFHALVLWVDAIALFAVYVWIAAWVSGRLDRSNSG